MKTDADEDIPLWQKRALRRIDEQDAKAYDPKRAPRMERLHFTGYPALFSLLHRAASARGIAVVCYMRRAIARQLAEDLGMDVLDVLATTPAPVPYNVNYFRGGYMNRAVNGEKPPFPPDDGKGFGRWPWS